MVSCITHHSTDSKRCVRSSLHTTFTVEGRRKLNEMDMDSASKERKEDGNDTGYDEEFSDAASLHDDDQGDENERKKRKFNRSLDPTPEEAGEETGDKSTGNDLEKLREDMKNIKSKMKTLVKEVEKMSIVMERLEAQEKKLLKVDNHVARVNDIVKDVSSEFKKVEKDVSDQRKEMKVMNCGMESCEQRLTEVEEKCIDLEGRGRRKNVIVRGLKEDKKEDGNLKSVEVARDFIRDVCKVPEEIVIERAHRIGKSRKGWVGSKANEPRPFIIRFLSYTDKLMVKQYAKKHLTDGISCSDDLPFAVRQARRQLNARFEEAKRDPAITDVYIAHPARLVINGRQVVSINPATCKPYPSRDDTRRKGGDNDNEWHEVTYRKGGSDRGRVRSDSYVRGGRHRLGGGGDRREHRDRRYSGDSYDRDDGHRRLTRGDRFDRGDRDDLDRDRGRGHSDSYVRGGRHGLDSGVDRREHRERRYSGDDYGRDDGRYQPMRGGRFDRDDRDETNPLDRPGRFR